MSNECVLRDSKLAETQLDRGMSAEDKFLYLEQKLEQASIKKSWTDLDLGCANLFGVSNSEYLLEYPELLEKKFNTIIPRLIEQQKYLFIVGHNPLWVSGYLTFWKNARVVFLTNYHDFVERRLLGKPTIGTQEQNSINNYWNIVRGESWPTIPPYSYKEFLLLDQPIRNELSTLFKSEIFKFFSDIPPTRAELYDRNADKLYKQLGDRAFKCDLQQLFNGPVGLWTGLSECATWVGVDINTHQRLILDYYCHWLDTITKI